MNAKISKQLYGPIRPGQRWKKRDKGMVLRIVCRQGEAWRVAFESKSSNSTHKIKEAVIYHYYEKL